MDVEKVRPEFQRMTFDEVSIQRSKNFVTALRELKNLRPQLHSAADYCEKSYLHSEQKQMVLDNLKDYAVRALVNAIDHLGTVAYKFSDMLEQHTLDVSSMDLRVTCVNQQLLTCQTYMDKEGLRQQEFLAIIPRHHKHYILPNLANKKVHFSPHIQTDPTQHMQARTSLYSSGASTAKTLSWHTKSTLKGSLHAISSSEDSKTIDKTSGGFNLLDNEEKTWANSLAASNVAMRGAVRPDALDNSKPLSPYRSFGSPTRREVFRPPVRSKSVLSSFFVKQKLRTRA